MPYTVMMVAAAGGSTRMGQPKQHILLGNRPVLIHTLLALQSADAVDEILLKIIDAKQKKFKVIYKEV